MSLKAVFLDREGVITPKLAKGEYLLHEKQAVVNPKVIEGLLKLQNQGMKFFVVSNQSCVSRGMISMPEAERLHQIILDQLSAAGVQVEESKICPHVDSDECGCRKPKPGMILELCGKYNIQPQESVMVGDSETDLQAGKNAGCAACIYISADKVHAEAPTCKNLADAADWILDSDIWKQK